MTTKTRVIGIRVEDSVFQRLEAMESRTGMEKVSLARAATMAALEHFEKTGKLSLPLEVVPAAQENRV